MNLIDKQYYLSLTVNNIFHNSFQTLLELSLILSSCYKSTHIQRIYYLVFQVFRDSPVNDFLSQPFCNSSFTDTRFADQYRVVFGTPAQDLQDSSDFFIPADYRVEFAGCGALVKIGCELPEKFQFSSGSIVLCIIILHN